MEMAESCKVESSFSTPHETYQFEAFLIVLMSASSTFQRMKNVATNAVLLVGLYIDDKVVFFQ